MWFGVVFYICWLGFFIVLAVTGFWNYFADIEPDKNLGQGVIGLLFIVVGGSSIRKTFRSLKRRRSLRHENTESGAVVYVWTELDGQEARSSHDPTPTWDAEDGGGDGDGDGGGGGD